MDFKSFCVKKLSGLQANAVRKDLLTDLSNHTTKQSHSFSVLSKTLKGSEPKLLATIEFNKPVMMLTSCFAKKLFQIYLTSKINKKRNM